MRLILAAVLTALATTVPAEPLITGTAAITDGDTIDLGPVRIRIHGIDAAEAAQRCNKAGGGTWPCGDLATSRIAELAEGKEVVCTALDRDAYGRIMARCYADGADVATVLITEGLAWAFTRYSDDYVDLEAGAQAEGTGIWQAETETPWDYRENRWERAAAASPRAGCPIKGNINREGERIYHTPWSPWYDRTMIDEANGEQWFCDEAEAQVAGWRPARWR